MGSSNYCLCYCTASNKKEAQKIAATLVREKLVACANIHPITSVYRWKKKIVKSKEVAMVMKTTAKKYAKAERRILSVHSYDCPCIVRIGIEGGSNDYLKWIADSVA